MSNELNLTKEEAITEKPEVSGGGNKIVPITNAVVDPTAKILQLIVLQLIILLLIILLLVILLPLIRQLFPTTLQTQLTQ